MTPKNILLIISGGIAAYKALELISLFRKNHHNVKCVLTQSGAEFITPLSLQTLSGNEVYQDLFSLTQNHNIEHISLTREADLIIIYPASANLIAKIALGIADNLASTIILAAPPTMPVLIAPAMNVHMWENPITQNHIQTLKERNMVIAGPAKGKMACGEYGYGRLISPDKFTDHIRNILAPDRPLEGKKALVTAGPTFEPIDPIRFIGNYSSGRQGYAIAESLRDAGAEVTLISGPVSLSPPDNINTVKIKTANEMLDACLAHLPVDMAVMTAAVSDWRVRNVAKHKIKKTADILPPILEMEINPDILAKISQLKNNRPKLVIGFAAETENHLKNAVDKRIRKGCDWIVVNDVQSSTNIMGGSENEVTILSSSGKQHFERASKEKIGYLLTQEIITFFKSENRG
ncbi:bifunctional phosphopantothenoylcysteine decarboxylase/phosphopantothenate--cysteine ligase CoaBC [Commensalibacter melissae]|uniref:bifunctional phosphopantothenoylcysteine decarboxylase/phosphopantothenate--cysteine ligase CoaBC n=1 Tax=Commensalibacter melissae TaxID=2070537 RepID=UPI0012DA00C6|nr:bifunctional phosphopantothenoylcysteine decarboxylase/phosphopantothenate--cysteine ligase CoaBC [Commensalibacter melissae]MUG77735.1 bifunctional phosphopantothenoylcysteine decarboxylase/phosphopantothenate--cysteine ligase CoaBC [Commensalibacter melissae]